MVLCVNRFISVHTSEKVFGTGSRNLDMGHSGRPGGLQTTRASLGF